MLISIRSNAHREEVVEDETIAMIVSGQMELDEDRAVIRYQETLDETLPTQSVTVTIQDDTITMDRGGEYATNMVFRMGCRYEGQYHTPVGVMDLAVFCNRLDYDIGEDGGDLQLSYQLDINGSFAAVHDLELHLLRQGNGC